MRHSRMVYTCRSDPGIRQLSNFAAGRRFLQILGRHQGGGQGQRGQGSPGTGLLIMETQEGGVFCEVDSVTDQKVRNVACCCACMTTRT